jgi:hypothetical protein
MANDLFKVTADVKSGKSPLEIFSRSDMAINPRHYFTIVFPMYVLEGALQEGRSFNKWSPRARVGVYLGMSPHHTCTVGLVLNICTRLVEPVSLQG